MRASLGRLAKIVISLELFLALGALGGGIALMAGPRGEIVPMPTSALAGSPFVDYFVPGAILFTVIGLGPIVAALAAWRRHRLAPQLTVATGIVLLGWLAVEIAIVGYASDPPLQPFYLLLGGALTILGIAWSARAARS